MAQKADQLRADSLQRPQLASISLQDGANERALGGFCADRMRVEGMGIGMTPKDHLKRHRDPTFSF